MAYAEKREGDMPELLVDIAHRLHEKCDDPSEARWQFTDDKERRLAIQAEAEADSALVRFVAGCVTAVIVTVLVMWLR